VIIIGERVNATRKRIRAAVEERDEEHIRCEIQAQDQAGAQYIDLNAGTGSGDRDRESEDLSWLVDLALDCTEKKLSLDSSDPVVLRRAAEPLGERRPMLLNSVSGERERLEVLLPFAAESGCPVIALAMGDAGIPGSVTERLAVCESILAAAAEAGVPEENVYLDPLVLPLSSDVSQGLVTLGTLREMKARFPGARTTLGLTNVSHGLPSRTMVNQAFLIAALVHGLDSAICDPTDQGIRRSITLGELVAGRDRYCRRYTRQIRRQEL
jgi:5-methyltetrahydrofolate corrinoid/iron sulfur protein methyltransferase